MKSKSFLYLAVAVLAIEFSAVSCRRDTEPSGISINPSSLTFTADASSQTVSVTTDGKWTAASDKDWVRLDPAKEVYETWNGSVNIIVDKNASLSARSAVVTFKAGSQSCSLNVSQEEGKPEPKIPDGTLEAPYDVAMAKNLIATGSNPSTEVYVKGIVSYIADIAALEVSEYGNATYYISDDGSMDNQFYVYHGMDLDGQKFAKMDDLKVGTKVVILGKLVNYNGTYEITSGSKLVEKDETGAVVAKPASKASAKWLELPATTENDGLYCVTHYMNVSSRNTRNYTYYYDKENLLAAWVAYPLSKWNKGSSTSRTEAWGYDPQMPVSWQPSLFKSYTAQDGIHGDRGHQIPSADRYANYSANVQTFYYTNMTPQLNAFNANIWGNVENAVRKWSSNCDTLYVVTGCVYKDSKACNLDNYGKKVTMPTGYFKTLLRKSGDSYSACALFFDHKEYGRADFNSEDVMSIDELETRTGLDFYVNLVEVVGQAKADEIEAANPLLDSFWGIKQ